MKRLKVNIILMDVDGTMTDVGGKRKTMALTPLEHLVRLVMEQYSIEADEAERKSVPAVIRTFIAFRNSCPCWGLMKNNISYH